MIGFYGSRIRDFTEIQPTANVTLIYGKHEISFEPADLQRSLSIYPNIHFQIIDGEHGFANPNSEKYKEAVAETILANLL